MLIIDCITINLEQQTLKISSNSLYTKISSANPYSAYITLFTLFTLFTIRENYPFSMKDIKIKDKITIATTSTAYTS
jgi:hypothetical protein